MIKNNPWVGVGAGLFGHQYYRYRSPLQSDAPKSAHNLFLDIASQTGLLSGILSIVLLIILLKSCSKNKIIVLVLGFVLIHSMVDWDFNTIGISFLFFIFCGLYSKPKYISLSRIVRTIIPVIKISFIILLAIGLIISVRSFIAGFFYISANQNYQFNNYQIARQQYRRATIINPYRAKYYLEYSFVQSDLESAKNSLLRATELAPYWYEPYYHLARINYIQGNLEKAQSYSDSALMLFPTSRDIKFLQDSLEMRRISFIK
jgi:hypothetical protein